MLSIWVGPIIEAWSTGRYNFAAWLVNMLVDISWLLLLLLFWVKFKRRVELYDDEICVGQVT